MQVSTNLEKVGPNLIKDEKIKSKKDHVWRFVHQFSVKISYLLVENGFRILPWCSRNTIAQNGLKFVPVYLEFFSTQGSIWRLSKRTSILKVKTNCHCAWSHKKNPGSLTKFCGRVLDNCKAILSLIRTFKQVTTIGLMLWDVHLREPFCPWS